MAALADPSLRAVIICPSNPLISIEPILAVAGVSRQALMECRAPVVAVSPIIGGRAVKGPTAKMLGELGIVAERRNRGPALRGISSMPMSCRAGRCRLDVERPDLGIEVHAARTLMKSLADREHLAHVVLDAADGSSAGRKTEKT